MVSTSPAHDEVRFRIPLLCSCCCIAALHRDRSPIWPKLHCQEGPTSSISSLNERQHQVEAVQMHVRRKRMARRSHLISGASLQACGVVPLPSGSPKKSCSKHKHAGRQGSRRSLVSCLRSGQHQAHRRPQALHRRLMTMSHTRRGTQQWVSEQSSMHGSLVVDILAGMRNEDMLMEAGVSAVDPHAPWLLNEVDSLRVMDMTVTYSRKLIADFLVFRRFFSEGLLVRSCCCPARQVMNSTVGWDPELAGRCEGCGRGDRCREPRIVGLVQQVMVAAPYLVPRVRRGAGRVQV